MRLVYSDAGMNCYSGNQFAKIIVDKAMVSANYDYIFTKLIKIEDAFFEAEADYVKKSGLKKSTYITSEKSLFSKKWMNDRIIQAYVFLEYHFYLYELCELLKKKSSPIKLSKK